MKTQSGNNNILSKIPDSILNVSKLVSAVLVISGACTAAFGALDTRLAEQIDSRLDEIQAEMNAHNSKSDQQITRLELINLISNHPENRAEVEKVARHYFHDLDGDWYASGIYSAWAEKYNGNINIILDYDADNDK